MNHLAHLFLSGENKAWMVGNFIADFLTPAEQRSMPGEIRKGIQIHLFIDRSVDNDPVFKKSIDLIRISQGKYAPVVADIYYDYLLYEDWKKYAVMDADSFIQQSYKSLIDELPSDCPEAIKQRVTYMVERNFLRSYTSTDYMGNTFGMLSNRVKFKHNLEQAASYYQDNLVVLKNHFQEVFPRMIESCLRLRLNLRN